MKRLNILLAPDPTNGGASAKPTAEQLLAENAALKERIAILEKTQKESDEVEKVIREKMSVGLSREQAISVIKRQKEHDARKAEEAAKAEEAKKTQEAAKAK